MPKIISAPVNRSRRVLRTAPGPGSRTPFYTLCAITNELSELRRRLGWTQRHTARQFDVCLRTWQRWEKSPTPPSLVVQLMRYKNGYLPGWPGFKVKGDVIYTPGNEAVHKNQIDAFWWLLQLKTNQARASNLPEIVQLIYQKIGVA